MLSVVIPTHESERRLVPTLAALVPGATLGLLTEVVIADGGSADATAEVADFAGCRFMTSLMPVGARLKTAALSTRTPWVMFLRPGCVPDPGWTGAAEHFIQTQQATGRDRAAIFRPRNSADLMHPGFAELFALLRIAFGGAPHPDQGLLISREFYDALGGHGDGANAEAALLRRLGRRRIAMLACAAAPPR